jgi:hypothetical protein
MIDHIVISRRAILGSLAALPVPSSTQVLAEDSTADTQLLVLGREFADAAAQLDYAIDHGPEIAAEVFDRLTRIETEIVATEAAGIVGLRVKARAACWALLGDLDPVGETTTDKRMALSIVRDLIRLYDSDLEHPGALKKLVEDSINGASHSAPVQQSV